MIGFDAIGALLIALGLALMTVCPLHLTIARTKEKAVWFSRAIHGDADEAPRATDRERAIAQADAELADEPLIRATGELADIFNHI